MGSFTHVFLAHPGKGHHADPDARVYGGEELLRTSTTAVKVTI